MISFFLKTTFRNLIKNKVFSLINIIGLTIGITSFILLSIYVKHELSYDKFFKNSERLYRVGLKYNIDGVQYYSALNPVPLAQGLKEDFPEIENVTRLYNRYFSGGYTFVTYEDRQYKEEKLYWADSTVFEVLGINLLQGNPKIALKNTNSVVITPKVAEKYFGNENPLGKILKFDDAKVYHVTGIAEPFPENSHLHFDLLASIHTNQKLVKHPDWIDVKNYVYILLKKGATINQITNKIEKFQKKYLEPEVKYITKLSYNEFKEKGNEFNFLFEPITDIHLKTIFEGNTEQQSDIRKVRIFTIIGFIILLIACINFINLTTAFSVQRAKEVGVKKILGASKRLIINQFLIETLFVTCISLIISLIAVKFCLPFFNNLLNLKLQFSLFSNWYNIPVVVSMLIVISFLAGGYPSLILSSFRSVDVIKGKFTAGKSGKYTRSVLVIVQNSVSVLLIISTLIIFLQLNYLHKKPLGFDTENLLIIQRPHKLKNNTQAFKEIIDKNPNIINSTFSYGAPQMVVEAMVYYSKEKNIEESYTVSRFPSDFDFIDTYNLRLIKGRKLDKSFSMDSVAVVLNETAVRVMGLTNPLEKEIYYSYEKELPLKIVGIVEDFHTGPLQNPIKPTIININRDRPPMYYIVKYRENKTKEVIEFIQNKWKGFLPGDVLDYKILEDHIKTHYKNEDQSGKVLLIFAVLSVFIASLGLFGMASYTTNSRVKEVGIRKVLGATQAKILNIMLKDLLKHVIISNAIAWPIAFYIMLSWLENYSYKINIEIKSFILSGLISLIIAFLTVSYKVLKISMINPTQCLHYE